MTKAEFVEDGMYLFESRFNASRPSHKRVKKPKDLRKVERGLDRGYDMREMGKDAETIRTELKDELYGSIWLTLFSFIWANYGDEIIAFILSLLFPQQATEGQA